MPQADDVSNNDSDSDSGSDNGAPPQPANINDLVRPDSVDVFMPPARMRRFAHLAFALVDPLPRHPHHVVRSALVRGGNPRVNLAPSNYGAVLILFENNAARELAMQNAPFFGQEHVVSLERHEETPNRFQFDHEAFVTVSVRNFPLEHWNRERIVFSAGPYANPHSVDPVCVHGNDYFSMVLLSVKGESVDSIPLEEYIKNHGGLGSLTQLDIVDVINLGDSDSDSDGDGLPPGPQGPAGGHMGGANDAPGAGLPPGAHAPAAAPNGGPLDPGPEILGGLPNGVAHAA